MAWTAPRTWVAGEIVTAAIMNTHVRDNLLEALRRDGLVALTAAWDAGSYQIRAETFQSDIATGTAPLTVASTTVVTNLNADQVDGQSRAININADHTHQSTGAEAGKLDHGLALDGLTDDDHTQYQKENLLTTAGDLPYATASSTWARLAIGAANQYLRVNAGATAPEWVAGLGTKQFFVPVAATTLSGGDPTLRGTYFNIELAPAGDACYFVFRVPNDLVTLTSVKIAFMTDVVGTFDWTVTTNFAANGEAYQTHTDSMTADGQTGGIWVNRELDISDAFTGMAANDIVGVKFATDVFTTLTVVDVLGLDVKYT